MMKRHAGQAGRIVGEALHQLGRIAMLCLVLVLLSVCLLGYRLSKGPLDIPYLASRLATAASGQGITVRMQQAQLAWAGYRQGGGVPLFLQLGDISIRNAVGLELVDIPSARLVFKPSALLGGQAPVLIERTTGAFRRIHRAGLVGGVFAPQFRVPAFLRLYRGVPRCRPGRRRAEQRADRQGRIFALSHPE